MAPSIRVGLGFDIHRLTPGRKLILGGVEIPFDRGLAGHSDADVVLHAVTDALLGAAGLPDIGEMFPDTKTAYENADSRQLLAEAWAMALQRRFVVANIDIVIHAEAPKLSAYKKKIAETIASLLGVSPELVGVKAKTNEGFGPVGLGDAMACTAVALLHEQSRT